MSIAFKYETVASCGIDCSICPSHTREKNRCYGCHADSSRKQKHCVTCKIITCEELLKSKEGFCYDCKSFPCKKMNALNEKYIRTRGMSLFENLNYIKNNGAEKFLKREISEKK